LIARCFKQRKTRKENNISKINSGKNIFHKKSFFKAKINKWQGQNFQNGSIIGA